MVNPFISVVNSTLPEPQASLLNGILFGVKTHMPRSLYESLVTTGVLHIIALSGMNISILTNLIARVTLVFGRRKSSIISIIAVIAFILFVGPTPSVVRAGIMAVLSLIAVYFGRQNWGLLSLLLAGGIMLIFDLSLVKNISFQLSFLATLGLVLAQRNPERQIKKGPLRKSFSIFKANFKLTLNAQIFTLPVILYNFHRLSLIAPLANIAIEWVIQPIMVLGFILCIVGWIWLPLGTIFAWIEWVLLTYLITVVDVLSKIPLASITF